MAGDHGQRKLGILAVLVISFSAFAIADFQEETAVGSDEGFSSSGFLRNKGKIIVEHCENDEQCTSKLGDLSQCNLTTTPTGTCECKPGAVGNLDGEPNTRCLIEGGVHIRERCEDSVQCVGTPGISSVCKKTGDCDCREGYMTSMNFDDCLEIQKEIGGPCKITQQCMLGTPGLQSECVDGTCKCVADSVSQDDVCYKKAVKVGEACDVDSQCLANLELSQCLGNYCRCWPGVAVKNKNGTRCHLIKKLGDECEVGRGDECDHISGADCHDGKCECDKGYGRHPDQNDTRCMKWAVAIEDSCTLHPSQCKDLTDTICVQLPSLAYRCRCNTTTQVASEDGQRCLPKMTNLNDSCSEDQQCLSIKNSNCTSNRCSCASGYVQGVENPNECLQIKGYGALCIEEIQCSALGSSPGNVPCNNGACRCVISQKYTNNHCVTPRQLTESCNLTDECIAGGNNMTWCVGKNGEADPGDKRCQCKEENMAIVADLCRQWKRIGDDCVTDYECGATIAGFSGCKYGMDNGALKRKCTCLYDDIKNGDGTRCTWTP